ncbi:MAG: hypothetical protein GEV03_20930 [Streptosporangiales bacterium]|nr:hypothetical protein [Streptosporangiales bacterium]
MKVLIAGAGPGGLTTALCLTSVGIRDVSIVESTPEIRSLGLGINLLPHAVRELSELGMGSELDRIGIPVENRVFFNRLGNRICEVPRGTAAGYRWPHYFIHRGVLQRELLARVQKVLGPDAIRTGVAVCGFEERGDQVAVELAEASGGRRLETADVLVGADGLHSAVRSTLFPDEGEPRWNGAVSLRGLTRWDTFLDGRTEVFCGDREQRFLAYPIKLPDGTVGLNWAGTVKDGGNASDSRYWNQCRLVKPVRAQVFAAAAVGRRDGPYVLAF